MYYLVNKGRDSSVGIATELRGGRSGDRIPVGARFSALFQTGPGAHPASYTMCTGSFPGVKRPGRGVHHPHSSIAEVKERVQLYLYSPSGPSCPVLGCNLLFSQFVTDHSKPSRRNFMTGLTGANVSTRHARFFFASPLIIFMKHSWRLPG